MAIPSRPLDSRTGTRLSRYPMNRPNIENTGGTEEKGRVGSWEEPKEMMIWEQENRDIHLNPPTQTD